jgi:hypothetical protein
MDKLHWLLAESEEEMSDWVSEWVSEWVRFEIFMGKVHWLLFQAEEELCERARFDFFIVINIWIVSFWLWKYVVW